MHEYPLLPSVNYSIDQSEAEPPRRPRPKRPRNRDTPTAPKRMAIALFWTYADSLPFNETIRL